MLGLAKHRMSVRTKSRVSGKKAKLVTGTFNPVPQEYAKPYRKTAYIFPYPTIVNQGLLYKQQGQNYGGIININDQAAPWLTTLYMDNEVSYSADRVVDARALTWVNPLQSGWEPQ